MRCCQFEWKYGVLQKGMVETLVHMYVEMGYDIHHVHAWNGVNLVQDVFEKIPGITVSGTESIP